ncbi:MAG: hypothetical protein RCG15_06040 [Candidatus Rickettsia vulgarisii]
MAGICEKGDETDHIEHIECALQYGLNPEDLPELYKTEIKRVGTGTQTAGAKKLVDILSKCHESEHLEEIGKLFFAAVPGGLVTHCNYTNSTTE